MHLEHLWVTSTHIVLKSVCQFYSSRSAYTSKSCHLRCERAPQADRPDTSSLQIRAERAEYAWIKPPSMHAPCVQPECGRLKVEPRAAASSACTAVQESRCSGASARAVPLPTPTARSPPMVCSVPKCYRRCRQPLSSCSHHLRANLPNARIVHGGEHGIFVRGYEDRPSMKGCSLCM